jgi:hypothetical protein
MTPTFDFSQRWKERHEYRLPTDQRINPNEFGVEAIGSDKIAKGFIETHHYSGSYPAAHVRVGLYRKTGVHASRLVGVAVFSEGVRSHDAMPKYTSFSAAEGTELGRLVLLPEVLHDGGSWFIARAFDVLRAEKPSVLTVLSYADPIDRLTSDGRVIKPGHFGTIYQATNALYLGKSSPRTLWPMPDGRVLHPYARNKLLARRKGWQAAERAFVAAGGHCQVNRSQNELAAMRPVC